MSPYSSAVLIMHFGALFFFSKETTLTNYNVGIHDDTYHNGCGLLMYVRTYVCISMYVCMYQYVLVCMYQYVVLTHFELDGAWAIRKFT